MKQDTKNLAEVNLLETFAELLADALEKRNRGPSGIDWIAQAASPLGRVRHCAAVRRRVAKGDASACIVGRDFKLTPAALQEELQAATKRRAPVKVEPSNVAAELSRELRKVGAR